MKLSTFVFFNIALILFISTFVIGSVSATDGDEEESTGTEIWNWVKSFMTKIFDALVTMVTAPINAISTIFGNWAGTMAHWYGPIVAVFVLAVCYYMIRLAVGIDGLMDMMS